MAIRSSAPILTFWAGKREGALMATRGGYRFVAEPVGQAAWLCQVQLKSNRRTLVQAGVASKAQAIAWLDAHARDTAVLTARHKHTAALRRTGR